MREYIISFLAGILFMGTCILVYNRFRAVHNITPAVQDLLAVDFQKLIQLGKKQALLHNNDSVMYYLGQMDYNLYMRNIVK